MKTRELWKGKKKKQKKEKKEGEQKQAVLQSNRLRENTGSVQ